MNSKESNNESNRKNTYKKDVSVTQDREHEDTMSKETNCNTSLAALGVGSSLRQAADDGKAFFFLPATPMSQLRCKV